MRWLLLFTGFVALAMLGNAIRGSKELRGVPAQRDDTPAKVRPISEICADAHIAYPPKSVFIRAFKQERELELWGASKDGKMHLLRTYPIAAASGGPGPKRREGDNQVPEGVYRIERFNPNSQFHLSLGLNYPNKSDRILGDSKRPGSDIFIHGNRVSIGCLAMTDEKIDEIYAVASSAGRPIPVHIFPCRMAGAGYAALVGQHPELKDFWRQLEAVYAKFESTHVVPKVTIDSKGNYQVRESGRGSTTTRTLSVRKLTSRSHPLGN